MMRILFLEVLVFLVLSAESVHAAPEWCEVLLSPEKVTRPVTDDTQGFIGYLGQLLDAQVIGTTELTKLEVALEGGTLVNPISEEAAQVSSRLLIHYEGLQDAIHRTQIDPARVLVWLRAKVSEREHVRGHREETREETQDPFQKTEFHRVEPGTFPMGERGRFVNTTLTEPFDLMSTQVTQRHWAMIMGANPSKFQDGIESIVITINGRVVRMQPDHPVEQVNWNQVQEFIKKLNRLSADGDPLLAQLIPDCKIGDRFRLPNEAEWEFVVKDRGRANGVFSFGDNEADLAKHGWSYENSHGTQATTHAVGQLKPLLVDGKAFYDLHGNVWEWVEHWMGALPYDQSAENDFSGSLNTTSQYVSRGGSFRNNNLDCRSGKRMLDTPRLAIDELGFRLARTRSGAVR